MDCLFCKIAAGDIPSDVVYEDKNLIAFRDINPQAPTHVLVIPRRHIATLNELSRDDAELIGQMVLAATKLAKQMAIDENGYRLVWNCNRDGGQDVFHIHLHLLGGRAMSWPPG